jgi:hypothetical protein
MTCCTRYCLYQFVWHVIIVLISNLIAVFIPMLQKEIFHLNVF